MQTEINRLKRKLKELDGMEEVKEEEKMLNTIKGYKRGRIKDESFTLRELEAFKSRIKNSELGKHTFKSDQKISEDDSLKN